MSKECQRCLNVAGFDSFLQMPIRINSDGICNQCARWDKYAEEFDTLRFDTKKQLPKIFEKIKKENHEYDALLALSGGKDSSIALILAKEKYDLNILAITTDKGGFYRGVKDNIVKLTDELGVDHIFFKAPTVLLNRLYRFGLKTLCTSAIHCKVCGGLIHGPIISKFMLKFDIPMIITGLDLWEIQAAFYYEKHRNIKMPNILLYTNPTLRKNWNNYELTIKKISELIELLAPEIKKQSLKEEFVQISDEIISRYGLSSSEIEEFNNLDFYDIALTAIEISSREEQLQLLEKYGWKLPKDMHTGEIVGTDCKIGGITNAIYDIKQKRRTWSYQIRSGLVTKEEALEELLKDQPNLDRICQTLKELGLKKLENRFKLGWENLKFKKIWNTDLIKQINKRLSEDN